MSANQPTRAAIQFTEDGVTKTAQPFSAVLASEQAQGLSQPQLQTVAGQYFDRVVSNSTRVRDANLQPDQLTQLRSQFINQALPQPTDIDTGVTLASGISNLAQAAGRGIQQAGQVFTRQGAVGLGQSIAGAFQEEAATRLGPQTPGTILASGFAPQVGSIEAGLKTVEGIANIKGAIGAAFQGQPFTEEQQFRIPRPAAFTDVQQQLPFTTGGAEIVGDPTNIIPGLQFARAGRIGNIALGAVEAGLISGIQTPGGLEERLASGLVSVPFAATLGTGIAVASRAGRRAKVTEKARLKPRRPSKVKKGPKVPEVKKKPVKRLPVPIQERIDKRVAKIDKEVTFREKAVKRLEGVTTKAGIVKRAAAEKRVKQLTKQRDELLQPPTQEQFKEEVSEQPAKVVTRTKEGGFVSSRPLDERTAAQRLSEKLGLPAEKAIEDLDIDIAPIKPLDVNERKVDILASLSEDGTPTFKEANTDVFIGTLKKSLADMKDRDFKRRLQDAVAELEDGDLTDIDGKQLNLKADEKRILVWNTMLAKNFISRGQLQIRRKAERFNQARLAVQQTAQLNREWKVALKDLAEARKLKQQNAPNWKPAMDSAKANLRVVKEGAKTQGVKGEVNSRKVGARQGAAKRRFKIVSEQKVSVVNLPNGRTLRDAQDTFKNFNQLMQQDPNMVAYAKKIRTELDRAFGLLVETGVMDKGQTIPDYIPHEVAQYAKAVASKKRFGKAYAGSQKPIITNLEGILERHITLAQNTAAVTKAKQVMLRDFGFRVPKHTQVDVAGFTTVGVRANELSKVVELEAKTNETLLAEHLVGKVEGNGPVKVGDQWYVPISVLKRYEEAMTPVFGPLKDINRAFEIGLQPHHFLAKQFPSLFGFLKFIPGFKQQVTISGINPRVVGFMTRNFFGDTARALILRPTAISPKRFIEGVKFLNRAGKDPKATIEAGGKQYRLDQISEFNGVSGLFVTDIETGRASRILYEAKFGGKSTKTILGITGMRPSLTALEQMGDAILRFNEVREGAQRVASIVKDIDDGKTLAHASRRSDEVFVNYQLLGKVEREFINKSLVPFWTWTAATFKDMSKAYTGKYGAGVGARAWIAGAMVPVATMLYNQLFWPEEFEVIDKAYPWRRFDLIIARWGSRIISIPLSSFNPAVIPLDILGLGRTPEIAFWALEGDLERAAQIGVESFQGKKNPEDDPSAPIISEVVQRLNPIIKVAFEVTQNKNTFTGAPIVNNRDPVGKQFGDQASHVMRIWAPAFYNAADISSGLFKENADYIKTLGTISGFYSATDSASPRVIFLEKQAAREAARKLKTEEFTQFDKHVVESRKNQLKVLRKNKIYLSLDGAGKIRAETLVLRATSGGISYTKLRKFTKGADNIWASTRQKINDQERNDVTTVAVENYLLKQQRIVDVWDEQQERRGTVAALAVQRFPKDNKKQLAAYNRFSFTQPKGGK